MLHNVAKLAMYCVCSTKQLKGRVHATRMLVAGTLLTLVREWPFHKPVLRECWT